MNIVKYEVLKREYVSNAIMVTDENRRRFYLVPIGSSINKKEADELIDRIVALLITHDRLKEMIKEDKANE